MRPPPDLPRHLFQPSFRYFAVVARVGSFRAAARELNVASSAVNRQILSLEEALGLQLFERIGKKLRLSAAGELLSEQIFSTLRDFEQMAYELDGTIGSNGGRVRIATIESVGEELLPAMISAFHVSCPGVDISVTVASSQTTTDLVTNGDADFGLTFIPAHFQGLNIAYLKDFEIGALVAADHPLATSAITSLKDCLKWPLALPSRGLSIRHALEATAALRHEAGRISLEANTLDLLKAVAVTGDIIAFQTRIGISAELRRGELVFVPLSDDDLALDRFAVVTRPTSRLGPAAARFHAQLLRDLPRLLPESGQ